MTSQPNRRHFLTTSASAVATYSTAQAQGHTQTHTHEDDKSSGPSNLRVARFRFDITPPQGHSLCGGWIKPVTGIDDALEAIGYVLLGVGKPIVICVLDWTGLLNRAHLHWRQRLAEAAGTTPDRVAVQCVHQHNAPFACLDADSDGERYEVYQKDKVEVDAPKDPRRSRLRTLARKTAVSSAV